MNKVELQERIKQLENLIVQQGQTANQINNNILMMHGAKEELNVMLNKLIEKESLDAQEAQLDAAANG